MYNNDNFTIYAIRCKENGKVYIGRTKKLMRESKLILLI